MAAEAVAGVAAVEALLRRARRSTTVHPREAKAPHGARGESFGGGKIKLELLSGRINLELAGSTSSSLLARGSKGAYGELSSASLHRSPPALVPALGGGAGSRRGG
nr:unnamed protein product [Digitaria exilis]